MPSASRSFARQSVKLFLEDHVGNTILAGLGIILIKIISRTKTVVILKTSFKFISFKFISNIQLQIVF